MVVLGTGFRRSTAWRWGSPCLQRAGRSSVYPDFQQLLLTVGWRTAFLVMAAFIAVLALPGALSVLCLKPSRKGLLPYGAVAASVQEEAVESGLSERKAPAKADFCLLLSHLHPVLPCCVACITGLGQHFPGMRNMQDWRGSGGAAYGVGLLMVGNIVSKLILGVLSDAIGPFRPVLFL